MRRALAVTAFAIIVTCGPLSAQGASAATAAGFADGSRPNSVVAIDDEPLNNDGDDDSGKYGLIGLSGLLGLFGYKKYREHREHRANRNAPIGGIDDGGGGRRS